MNERRKLLHDDKGSMLGQYLLLFTAATMLYDNPNAFLWEIGKGAFEGASSGLVISLFGVFLLEIPALTWKNVMSFSIVNIIGGAAAGWAGNLYSHVVPGH